MLTTIREYLPLKTILFSTLVLILSANSPSSSSPDSASDMDSDGYGNKNWIHESDLPVDASLLAKASYGVLVVANSTSHREAEDETFCTVHYNEGNLPRERRGLPLHRMMIWNDTDTLCSPSGLPSPIFSQSIVFSPYNITGCNVSTQAQSVEFLGGKGLLLQLDSKTHIRDIAVDANSTKNVSFVIAVIGGRSHDLLTYYRAYEKDLRVGVFSPPGSEKITYPFDLSIVVIWLIAVFTLVVGSYWSGVVRYRLFVKKKFSTPASRGGEPDRSQRKKERAEEEPYLNISPLYVLFFVGCMAGMLLALYFFFRYLVYVMIGLFVVASILSSFVCLDALAKKILPKRATAVTVPCLCRGAVYQLVVLGVATSLSLSWFFLRKKRYSWILQDILGVFFSINMLRTIRLPSFKICTILLTLLFVYDIFFVFITPLLTASRKSIMVEVATGGSPGGDSSSSSPDDGEGDGSSSQESLPMLLRVEHLSIVGVNTSDPLEVCYRDMRTFSYSLLGFGDILVPGLLVSYCHAFDLIHGIRGRLYFLSTSIAYAVGLIITFVGLFLMKGVAQPALLYLVPCTLIPPIVIALRRKQFKALWDGPGDGSEESNQVVETIEDDDEDTDNTHDTHDTGIRTLNGSEDVRHTDGNRLLKSPSSNTSASLSQEESPPPPLP